MVAQPAGTVTFLFTDLEGSSRMWEEVPDGMADALARHDEILRVAVAERGGYVVKMTGDGAHAAFATAGDAVAAAVAAQLALRTERWEATGPLRVRMGLHTGTAELRDGDYFGADVNRAARLMAVAHGGQVLCSGATAELARAALHDGAALVDLGEQQLRDLQTPERVFQVVHPDLPADFPTLRTLDAFPGNLPLQVTDFVGRDDELAELAVLLPRSRVVTLTGSGGVGKTRLALQAAAAAVPDYEDGAWFVDLAAVDDETFVASAIAATMGLPEHRQGSRDDALAGALGRRHALVVLDNCEHLVERVADVVDLVVHRCPRVTVLATSQEGLGVDGEVTLPVRPLREQEAERLFVERAMAARHGFALSSENAAAVGELCRRLDGIPLAIELAAARVASMSPTAILERIDERFRLLGHGRRTARRRHQTLRAAVDWSYGLLSPAEQLVFERLAVFAGSCTLDAAEAVVAGDDVDPVDVLDLVTGLVAKSMVHLDERAAGDRYRLLETMRDYGLERLAERDQLEVTQRRHAECFLAFAEAEGPGLLESDDSTWLRIEQELPNLRAALAFFRATAADDEFRRFAFALARFWDYGGYFREGLDWLPPALALEPRVPSRARADALAIAGHSAINLDRYDVGMAFIEESLACAAAIDEPPPPLAFNGLALMALVQNRSEDAVRYSEEAVAVARAVESPYELAAALSFAANVISLTGGTSVSRALELAEESVVVARGLGNTKILILVLGGAGVTWTRVDPAKAIDFFEQSYALPHSDSRAGIGTLRAWKAISHLLLRDYTTAARELHLAIRQLQESGEPYQLAVAMGVAAAILSRPDPDVAIRLLGLLDQQRTDGRFVGAENDLAVQAQIRARLEARTEPERFAACWAEGARTSMNDGAAAALEALAAVAEPGSRDPAASE